MAAYMIFIREGEVFNPKEMELYQNANRSGPDPAASKLKPLVVYGNMETLEGEAADGIVVLEFPSVEDARAWYFSPEYQQRAEHRRKAAHYRAFLVEGFG